jgi:hypothetical protein
MMHRSDSRSIGANRLCQSRAGIRPRGPRAELRPAALSSSSYLSASEKRSRGKIYRQMIGFQQQPTIVDNANRPKTIATVRITLSVPARCHFVIIHTDEPSASAPLNPSAQVQ